MYLFTTTCSRPIHRQQSILLVINKRMHYIGALLMAQITWKAWANNIFGRSFGWIWYWFKRSTKVNPSKWPINPKTTRKNGKLSKEIPNLFSLGLYGNARACFVEHRLPIKKDYKPFKQPPWRFDPELLPKIICPCMYADWLSNIVPVTKKNGKIRFYIDFQDLNLAHAYCGYVSWP